MATGFFQYRFRLFFLLIIAAFCAPVFSGASESLQNKPFLAASINNSNPFAGQEVLLTYRLYFKNTAPKISNETAPSLQGLWAKETGSERFIKSIPTTIQGEQFRGAIIKQFRLVPLQSGRITIAGYSMLCTLPQEQSEQEKRELPESRFRITAPAITITARNLPVPVPEKFSGAIGDFTLDLICDKQNLRAGEPLSLKLILAGTGSLSTLKLPDILLPESFHHNPPEKKTTLTNESVTASGTITATTIAWPQSTGDFQIPALSLVVFNPETSQFSTLHSKPLSIRISTADTNTENGRERAVSTSRETKSSAVPTIMAIGIGLLLLISTAAILLLRKKRPETSVIPGADNKEGHQFERAKSARNMKQELFALLVERGIQSPEGLTRMELNKVMQEINIPDEIRIELTGVLDSLDRILYSPARDKEAPIPDGIAARVNAVLNTVKKTAHSR